MTHVNVSIRPFQDDDEPAVVGVWHRSGQAAYAFLPLWQALTLDRAGKIFREVIRVQCNIWVGTLNEQIVAYLAMRGSYVDRMYVDPSEWRKGWGTRLVVFAKTLSPDGLELHTHQANDAARRLYEKQGFNAVKFGTSPPPESAPDVEYHWRPDNKASQTDHSSLPSRLPRGPLEPDLSDRSRLRVVIRRESIADRDAIRSLTARAFSGLSFSDGTEPLVIDALREANALALSLVAVLREQVVGHVAFSEVGPPAQSGWLALGPVSVEPPLQRRGVGSQLIEAGLQSIREQGAKGCVLVGDHRYYHRFGFVVAPAFAPSQYPPQHFQVDERTRFARPSPRPLG